MFLVLWRYSFLVSPRYLEYFGLQGFFDKVVGYLHKKIGFLLLFHVSPWHKLLVYMYLDVFDFVKVILLHMVLGFH